MTGSGSPEQHRGAGAQELADVARRAARATFREFADDPGSLYYCAVGMSAEQTWETIREDAAAVSAVAALKGSCNDDIGVADLTTWHRAIFERTFPGRCGELRAHEEDYGYVVGTREQPVLKTGRGTGWRRVPRRLSEICAEFNAEAARMDPLDAADGLRLVDATRAAARLYAKLLAIHPFEDGNGRTAYTVLAYALVRVDAVVVELADFAELQWALGRALQPGGRGGGIEPLAKLLARRIHTARARDLS